MTQTIKAGTRVELLGTEAFLGFPGVASEQGKIVRWTARNGAIKNHVSPTNGGWHIVEFSTGGRLCVHETRFRVVDNRAAA